MGADTTKAARQARLRDARRAAGLTRVEVWVPVEARGQVRELERQLQQGVGYPSAEGASESE